MCKDKIILPYCQIKRPFESTINNMFSRKM